MTWLRALAALLGMLAAAALAFACEASGLLVWVVLAVFVALMWLVAEGLRLVLLPSLLLIVVIGFSAAGIMQGAPVGWLVAAVVLALFAWSLGHFARRLGSADYVPKRAVLVRAMLARLLVLGLISAALTALAMHIRVRLSFIPALLVGILLFYALTRVIGTVRREGA